MTGREWVLCGLVALQAGAIAYLLSALRETVALARDVVGEHGKADTQTEDKDECQTTPKDRPNESRGNIAGGPLGRSPVRKPLWTPGTDSPTSVS